MEAECQGGEEPEEEGYLGAIATLMSRTQAGGGC